MSDERAAYELFSSMRTLELRALAAAHRGDRATAATPETVAFCAGRIALIEAVLAGREQPALVLRVRYQQAGGHVHCRVFSAPRAGTTFAKCGELVFSVGEWADVRARLEAVVEMLEDEGEA